MRTKSLYRMTIPVTATLTAVVLSLFWIGQALSAEPTVKVYKSPT